MSVRESVFGSPRERRLFKALESRWGGDYNLYPGLKFHNILRLSGFSLSQREREFLLATEVDYTLCDQNDRAIVSVEFDGVTGGLSRDGVFMPRAPGSSSDRKWKFDLKLRVAELAGYPFVVVSAEEAIGAPGEDAPMIVDGIIGQVLAQRQVSRELAQLSDALPEQVEGLSEEERDGYIQDRVTEIEVLAELQNDPFASLANDLRARLREAGQVRVRSELRWLEDDGVPQWPEGQVSVTKEEFAALLSSRAEALEAAPRHGAEVVIHTGVGTFTGRAWIRNFGLGAGCLSLAENIASVRALRRALRAARRAGAPPRSDESGA